MGPGSLTGSDIIQIVLVDRKTDRFQDEISPDIKKWVKMKSLISVHPFSIPGKFHPGTCQFFCQQVLSQRPPGHTDTCENITLPQTSSVGGNVAHATLFAFHLIVLL